MKFVEVAFAVLSSGCFLDWDLSFTYSRLISVKRNFYTAELFSFLEGISFLKTAVESVVKSAVV